MAEADEQRREARTTNDNASSSEQATGNMPFAPYFPAAAPAPLPTRDRWSSEWFAPPGGLGAAPADTSGVPPYRAYEPYATPAQQYPPPPELYRTVPAPPVGNGLPLAQSAGALSMPGVRDSSEGAYPAYAPGGVVDTESLRNAPNPHETAGRAGRPEAAGCASGAAIIGVLSKFLIGVKFLLPVLSALVSFWLYAALFGWQFALGIIALLFVHEMGHFVVIRSKGLPASLPVFIPLLGAYVAMRSMPHNVRDEAEIGIAGPIAGGLGGLLCLGLYFQTHLLIMIPLAYFSFLINLLNLVPVAPLDGARVTGAISRWFWPVGLVLLAIGFFYTRNLFILLIGVIGFFQMLERFRATPLQQSYYAVSPLVRVYITALYFGLIAALTLGLIFSQGLLPAVGGSIF